MGVGSKEFVAFVTEQLRTLGEVTASRFFGGVALKSEAALFGMIMDGALYFAVDDELRSKYRQMGSRCFSYATRKGRVDVKRFFEVPADIVEEPEQLVEFARASIAAARRAAAGKSKAGKKTIRTARHRQPAGAPE